MKVLVTGGAGFIGSHIVRRMLDLDHEVVVLDNFSTGRRSNLDAVLSDIDVSEGDVGCLEQVEQAIAGCDAVFHQAALPSVPRSIADPLSSHQANATGTLNVLEAARRGELQRIVHTSTSEVYGTAQEIPIHEEHRLHPQSPYAATKVAADQLALSYQRSFDTPVAIVRPFNTYGPRQSARAVIPTIVTQALARETIELGATDTTRDFVYVGDTVAGMMSAGRGDGIEGEVINLGTGVEVSIAEVVQRVLGLLERDVPVSLDDDRLRPSDSEVERLVADISKAKALLGWAPEVDLDEGLQRTIDWLTGSLSKYKPTIYNV